MYFALVLYYCAIVSVDLAVCRSEYTLSYLQVILLKSKLCSCLPQFALSLQEELEENAQTSIYDDYKFLTKEELEKLNLTSLIGTNLLRAYMHGFFIDYRLYKKVSQFNLFLTLFESFVSACGYAWSGGPGICCESRICHV